MPVKRKGPRAVTRGPNARIKPVKGNKISRRLKAINIKIPSSCRRGGNAGTK